MCLNIVARNPAAAVDGTQTTIIFEYRLPRRRQPQNQEGQESVHVCCRAHLTCSLLPSSPATLAVACGVQSVASPVAFCQRHCRTGPRHAAFSTRVIFYAEQYWVFTKKVTLKTPCITYRHHKMSPNLHKVTSCNLCTQQRKVVRTMDNVCIYVYVSHTLDNTKKYLTSYW